jgi:hypothetical protein
MGHDWFIPETAHTYVGLFFFQAYLPTELCSLTDVIAPERPFVVCIFLNINQLLSVSWVVLMVYDAGVSFSIYRLARSWGARSYFFSDHYPSLENFSLLGRCTVDSYNLSRWWAVWCRFVSNFWLGICFQVLFILHIYFVRSRNTSVAGHESSLTDALGLSLLNVIIILKFPVRCIFFDW